MVLGAKLDRLASAPEAREQAAPVTMIRSRLLPEDNKEASVANAHAKVRLCRPLGTILKQTSMSVRPEMAKAT